ncbi:tetratricopeptide repeat-containing sensor histidine kinase [Tenacibaculum amylolyticum]|uniref:tetratricopeptide repeat-containing sensor histidine kinase n=1 Tax=Tenacibaculum amylolyticum TaxID=104269 RepID=UPI00389494FE
MQKLFFYTFFCALLLSCQQENTNKNVIDQVYKLQQKAVKNINSSYNLLLKSSDLIEKNSSIPDSLKSENNYLLGKYFESKGKLDSAAIFFHNATDYVTKRITKDRSVDYFVKAWNVYFNKGKYGDCISLSNKLQKLLASNDFANLIYLNYQYENVYKADRNFKKALEYNKLQIENYKKADSTKYLIRESLIQQIYYRYNLGQKKRAFKILDSLIRLKKILTPSTKYTLYNEYGAYQYYDNNYKNALKNYLFALENLHKIPNNDFKNDQLAISYLNISEVYMDLKNHKDAELYLDSVASLGFRNISTNLQRITLQYELRLASLTNKDISKISVHLDSLYNYQRTEFSNKYNSDLLALKKSLDNEKKVIAEKNELEVTSLKRLFTLSIIALIVLVVGILLYKQRQYRFEKLSIQMQQRLLRSQMNPHFTFNTLYAIQNQITAHPKNASNYLLKFSRLLRIILENSTQNYVLLNDELEILEKYIDLQLLRFPNKFTVDIKLENLDRDDFIFIPPMLLQPMIENSIEHGFAGINYLGEIQITLIRKEHFLTCIIEDNGKGMRVKNEHKKSTSIKLINDYLKKTTKKGITIINKSTINSAQTGVKVTLEIPYKLTDND